jgi:hypothetical protein
VSDYRERLSANANDFDGIVSEILAENESLRTQLANATRKLEEARKENHNLNWALGTEGYDQMATPEKQAEHEKAVENCTAIIAGIAERKANHDAMVKDAERYRYLRDNCSSADEAGLGMIGIDLQFTSLINSSLVGKWPDALDKSIDQAIEQGKGGDDA